jgi:hypothetical protein
MSPITPAEAAAANRAHGISQASPDAAIPAAVRATPAHVAAHPRVIGKPPSATH